jgi:hypothetical protein
MAEKRTIELEIQDNSKSLKQQYREAVQELQRVSAQYGETSQEAVRAAKAAADLNDQIQFSKDLVSTFNPDAKFDALTRSVGGVLDGFQAFEGALGLIGVDANKLQETMVRLQSVMALSQGLQGLMEAKDSFKQLGTVAVNALKGIRTGIAATGIGLLLVAVGSLVAYWDDIKEAVKGVSSEQEKITMKIAEDVKLSEEKVSQLDKQDNILKLQGKTERQILEYKIAELDTAIKIAQVNLENQKAVKIAQVEAANRNKDILLGIISFLNKPLVTLLETIDEIVEWATGDKSYLAKALKAQELELANLFFDPDTVGKEGDKAIAEAELKLTELKNQQAGYKLQIQQIDQQAAAKSVSTSNKTAKELKDIERDLIDERLRIMEDGFDKEYAILKEKRRRDKEDAEKDFKDGVLKKSDYEKLLLQIDESFEADRKKIYENNKEERIAARDFTINALIEEKKTEAEIEMAAWMEKRKKQKERDAEEIAARRKKEELILMSTKDSLQIASDLTQLFANKSDKQQKKAFMIQKGINIANATVDTYGAATKALREYPSPFNYIAMAAAITAGLLNIKKIQQTQFNASGSGGGGSTASANAPEAMTANFSTIGSSGINQLAQLQQKPTQAYVVSGEVTSAQALDRNRVQNATL